MTRPRHALFFTGTGNVLKIQELLHTCSEYHGTKEEEEAEPEADSSPKAGGEGGGGGGKDETAEAGKDSAKKSDSKTGGKDVEMKDAEAAEPGSLTEPGAHQAISVPAPRRSTT